MPTMSLTIRPARLHELDHLLDLTSEVFFDEAVLSWVIPDPVARRDDIRRLFTDSLRQTVEAGELVLAITPEGEAIGVSFWHEISSHSKTTSDPVASDGAGSSDPRTRRLHVAATATSARQPSAPHLYLSAMATHPDFRGRGAGKAVLDFGLTWALERDLPVYLEASTPQNRRLYLRHGFADDGSSIALPEAGPTLQPMWRPT